MIVYGHHLEAHRALFDVAFGKEALRGADHNALLFLRYAEFRQRGGVFFHRARANFDKRQRLAVVANQVRFTFDSSRHVAFRNEHLTWSAQVPICISLAAHAGAPCLQFLGASSFRHVRIAREVRFLAQASPCRPADCLEYQAGKDWHSSRVVI